MQPGHHLRLWSALIALGGAASLGATMGCATASSSGDTSTAAASGGSAGEADDDASAAVKEYHRHHPRGGVTAFVALSLDTLAADPEKKAQVEKIQSDLHEKMAPVRDAEKALVNVLADGVAAGAVDTTKADAAVAALTTAAAAAHDASLDALNQLHAVLSPAERAELTEKVQAHFEVWRDVNHTAPVGGKEAGGRLAHLTAELNLSQDQVDRISAALQASASNEKGQFDPAQAEAHVQAFTTAFASETFDAHSLPAPGPTSHLAHHGGMRMEHFLTAVAPVLTNDQRTQLAADLREHLNHSAPAAAN